jgi:LEA14-like dessication related protein
LKASLMAALAFLGACQGALPPATLTAPELRVSRLQLEGLQGGQARIGLTLEAWNPNEVDLPLSQVQFEMLLFGQAVGRGRVEEPRFVLPAREARALPVSLEITHAALARALRRGLSERILGNAESTSDWVLQGSLRWGSIPVELPFRKQGRLEGLGRSSSRTAP